MHEVENMFAVGEAPWHRLGTVLGKAPDIDTGLRLAGLDWQVGLEPVFLADGSRAPAMATVRNTDRRILGIVGPRYRPLQNADAFGFFEPLVRSGEVSLESAGSLRDGQRVWVLARINRAPEVVVREADDIVRPFLLVANGHDGSLALRVGFTAVRVVCANTLATSIEPRVSRLLRVRHHARAADALVAIRDTLDLAMAQFRASSDQYRLLAQRKVSVADLRRYVIRVLRPHAEPTVEGDPYIEQVIALCEAGRGNSHRAVMGTWWSAFNGLTEHLAHERGRDEDRRLDGLWFGEAAQLNRRALDVALEMAA